MLDYCANVSTLQKYLQYTLGLFCTSGKLATIDKVEDLWEDFTITGSCDHTENVQKLCYSCIKTFYYTNLISCLVQNFG